MLRAQESRLKLPIMFLHTECHLPKHNLPNSADIIPTNLISTLHILLNLVITYMYVYFLCLHAIENPIMIG